MLLQTQANTSSCIRRAVRPDWSRDGLYSTISIPTHAASAGTYILYATHIAAMAPGTNLGAATPVQIGSPVPGLPGTAPDKRDKSSKDSERQLEPKDAMTAKVTNDAVALIRSLAEWRGRNADWAEKAVREAASFSANSALQANVIDLIARSSAELLTQVDGRVVEIAGGEMRHLATKDVAIEAVDPGLISRFLAVITDPNVAFVLMVVGIYGLILEFTSPGAVAPGVVGTICLLLGFYALNLLPISYAGLGLLLLGIALLVIEAFNPTVVLGIGGVIGFVLGALMLFNVQAPGYHLSCYDGLATLYLDQGNVPEAERYFALAHEVCARHGLDPEALIVLPFLD